MSVLPFLLQFGVLSPHFLVCFDRVSDQALADQCHVGAVVFIDKDGQLIYRRAARNADREAAQSMNEATAVPAGTNTLYERVLRRFVTDLRDAVYAFDAAEPRA